MFETFRIDPIGHLKRTKGEDALQKFEKKYQRKASRRADIALNGLLHVSRSTRREWSLLPVKSVSYQQFPKDQEPSWYEFYQRGYKAGVVAVTTVVEDGQAGVVAAVDQNWGIGMVGGAFYVPQTAIAVMVPEANPGFGTRFVTADDLENGFERIYSYRDFEQISISS